jgi:hypothetical protein
MPAQLTLVRLLARGDNFARIAGSWRITRREEKGEIAQNMAVKPALDDRSRPQLLPLAGPRCATCET